MPSTLELINEGEGSRLVLVLSNKKDSYYVVTPAKCSCPAATYHPGQPCKHQRKHFPQVAMPAAEEESIRPECKWPGGLWMSARGWLKWPTFPFHGLLILTQGRISDMTWPAK
jgi:CubicO group peptidase (beta-lactamase class C family)